MLREPVRVASKPLKGAAMVAVVLLVTGCSRGMIYTDITSPLTDNMTRTKVGTKSGTVSSSEVRIPMVRGSLSGAWRSRAIGDAAESGGLKEVYYADERTQSLLMGIWARRTVTAYGE